MYIFSVNPYLGPLQVSLSRMVLDIMKFFFLYVLVLFAFSCGKYICSLIIEKVERRIPSKCMKFTNVLFDINVNLCHIFIVPN